MTALVAAVEALDFARQRDLLIAARTAVAAAAEPDAFDAAEQARLVREWLKVIKGAGDLAVEATRLECVALRRLSQLNADQSVHTSRRAAGRYFAAMSDEDFDRAIEAVGQWTTAVGIHRALVKVDREAVDRRIGLSVGSGGGGHHPLSDYQLSDLVEAAGALLNEYASEGKPFTLAEVADEIAENLSPYSGTTAAMREGLREAVRQAIRADDGGVDDHYAEDAPAWVTYYEGDCGWVRVPWRTATIDQLASMVALRRKQLAEIHATTTRLEGVLDRLARAHERHPDEVGCFRLDRLSTDFMAAS